MTAVHVGCARKRHYYVTLANHILCGRIHIHVCNVSKRAKHIRLYFQGARAQKIGLKSTYLKIRFK